MEVCPICKTKVNDTFDYCRNCAWEFEYYFDELTEEEKDRYSKRLEVFKSIYLQSIDNVKFQELNQPNKVSRFFHKNGTAYSVMDDEEGEDLQDYIKRHNSFTEEEILSIIMPILDGLRDVHDADFLHRNINPRNIYIRDNASPMLIDFGASRMAMGIKSQSLPVVLTEGYAPKEQYSSTSKQGAYTDLYSIGAVMYKMATGITPPEANARADAIADDEADPFVKLQDRNDLNYSDNFKKAVDWALEFSGKNRPQGVVEFQEALSNRKITHPPLPPLNEQENDEKHTKNNKKSITIIMSVVILLLFLIFYFIHIKPINNEIKNTQKEIWKLKNISSNTENYIEDIIANGSNKFNYPMGMMPPGMATGQDAKDIAIYISNGMESTAPIAYVACISCHGEDLKGNSGMSPDLTKVPLLGMKKKIQELEKQIAELEKEKYSLH